MPPDNRPTRKALRSSTEEEIERWRSRGEISCAECKRLKQKCDKVVPCGSCVRRGCAAICPNGSLSSGNGTRFVLADTEELHKHIAVMGQRIRSLEDALANANSMSSTEADPLLTDELKQIKFRGSDARSISHFSPSGNSVKDHLADTITAMGTLTIRNNGTSEYFGHAAGTAALLTTQSEIQDSSKRDDPHYSDDMNHLERILTTAILFDESFNSGKAHDLLKHLSSSLPARPRALELLKMYEHQIAWMFTPITFEDVFELSEQVHLAHEQSLIMETATNLECIAPHKLSVLFLVYAMGALMDTNLPPFNDEAARYYKSAIALMTLRPVLTSPTVETVQAVALIAFYVLHDGRRNSFESAWTVLALASKLAQSCGLHRDCGSFGLDARTVQRRRFLFWELFSLDTYFSAGLGRPAAMNLAHADCEFPDDKRPGKISLEFYETVKAAFVYVLDYALAIKVMSYDEVVKIDRLIRDKIPEPPKDLLDTPFAQMSDLPFGIMKYIAIAASRSSALIYLHRGFFAQAIMEHPGNPLHSKYATSFTAAYREASWVIKAIVFRINVNPNLCTRWWSIWTHVFTAALIVGTIATRAPTTHLAPVAFSELCLVIDAFQKAARDSRSRGSLAILMKLRDTAVRVSSAIAKHNNSQLSVDSNRISVAWQSHTPLHDQSTHTIESPSHSTIESRHSGADVSPSVSQSQPSAQNVTNKSPFLNGFDPVPSQNGLSWYVAFQQSLEAYQADMFQTEKGSLSETAPLQPTMTEQSPTAFSPEISTHDRASNVGMFEAAGTADQAWDHSWMSFLHDTGLQ